MCRNLLAVLILYRQTNNIIVYIFFNFLAKQLTNWTGMCSGGKMAITVHIILYEKSHYTSPFLESFFFLPTCTVLVLTQVRQIVFLIIVVIRAAAAFFTCREKEEGRRRRRW